MKKAERQDPAPTPDRKGHRPFFRMREGGAALFVLGFAVGSAIVWALYPEDERHSITVALREARAVVDLPADRANAGADRRDDRSGEGLLSGLPATRADATVARRPSTAGETPPQLAALPRDAVGGLPSDAASITRPTVERLERSFRRIGYDLASVRAQEADVPRLVPLGVPADLAEVQEIDRKKSVFFQMVLPLVLMANERLAEQRARIVQLRKRLDAGEAVSRAERNWLDDMFETYKVEKGDFAILLRRVDVVPPSLALAQAAIESGWGTSRFAQEGNALFGQWVWGDGADGIVPKRRSDGQTHKIRVFDNPLQAVAAYIRNLNTHRAYLKFRKIRATLRAQGAGLNGLTLAAGLEAYSEKGAEYVRLVRQIISVNELRPLDRAKLAKGPPNNV